MPKPLFACVLTLSCLPVAATPARAAHAQQPTEVLTNQTVIDLVRSGMSADIVTTMIKSQPNKFVVTSSAVIRLKQQGVPQAVISSMLAAAHSAPASTESPGTGDRSKSTKPTFAWERQVTNDPMTGKSSILYVLDTPAVTEQGERIGLFEKKASCTRSQMDFVIAFIADTKPGFGFKQNTTTYYVTGGLFGAMQAARNHKQAWTETRVRVDNAQPTVATAEDDYKNQSSLYFVPLQNSNDSSDASALRFLGAALTANKPVGTVSDFFSAKKVLFESVFEHGEQALLEVHPQDASFTPFAHECLSAMAESEAPASTAAAGNSPRELRPTDAAAVAPPPRPSLPAPRYFVTAGSSFKVTLLDAVDLKGARAAKPVRARVVESLITRSTGMPATGANGGGPVQNIVLPVGTELTLLSQYGGGTSRQAKVRLRSQSFLHNGQMVALNATSDDISVSTESPLNSVIEGFGRARPIPFGGVHTSDDTVLLKANTTYTFTITVTTSAPAGYHP